MSTTEESRPGPAPAPTAALDTSAAAERANQQIDALRRYLKRLESALVCYSGGIDSALVLATAHEVLGHRAVGITAVSDSLAPMEREGASRFAASIGARHHFVNSNEIQRPGYAQNGPDRCFHCKSELYEIARSQLERFGVSHILNGTNADDQGDYRPGLKAADEAGVRSPLAELGFTKQDVRAAARLLGLSIWHKPASACLSSRIPYGTSVTPQRLSQIAQFEQSLKELGFVQVRVRYHGPVARLELGTDELARAVQLREPVTAAGKSAGFQYVALDLQGYRLGSHNEVLERRRLNVV